MGCVLACLALVLLAFIVLVLTAFSHGRCIWLSHLDIDSLKSSGVDTITEDFLSDETMNS